MSFFKKKSESSVPDFSLSNAISPKNIALDEIARFGLGFVSCASYDNVQSLLGLGGGYSK